MALTLESKNFQHIVRLANTNVDGHQKTPFALTAIRGLGCRLALLVVRKCDIDPNKRAGELTVDETDKILAVLANPQQFLIPEWMLNRRRDFTTGATEQLFSNKIDSALRDDLERMKKIRVNRGLRHAWGARVRGQHTKTTGRGR